MARTYNRDGVWYLDYRDEKGKRQRLATDARKKGEAGVLLAEKVAQIERRKLGLDAAPVASAITVWGLCDWWLKKRCKEPSLEREKFRLEKHVLKSSLGSELAHGELLAEKLENYFRAMEKEGAEPGSVNHLRAKLRAIINAASRKDAGCLFVGKNPVLDTKSRKVPKKRRATIVLEEVDLLLSFVPERWRGIFAVAIYLALRKGEIFGLKKMNVRLQLGVITVANSYRRNRPKGGDQEDLPIPAPLRPYLERAMENAQGEFLFPKPNEAGMRSHHLNPEKILRTALKRAGMVDGYRHTCRWCGFDKPETRREGAKSDPSNPIRLHRESLGYTTGEFAEILGIGRTALSRYENNQRLPTSAILTRVRSVLAPKTQLTPPSSRPKFQLVQPDATPRRCPQCNRKLLAIGIPRGGMRFHDMRHSTATILLRAGEEMYTIQKVLRHANIKTTIDTYGHLDLEDTRRALAVFAAAPTSKAPPPGEGAAPRKLRLAGDGTNAAQSNAVANLKGGKQ